MLIHFTLAYDSFSVSLPHMIVVLGFHLLLLLTSLCLLLLAKFIDKVTAHLCGCLPCIWLRQLLGLYDHWLMDAGWWLLQLDTTITVNAELDGKFNVLLIVQLAFLGIDLCQLCLAATARVGKGISHRRNATGSQWCKLFSWTRAWIAVLILFVWAFLWFEMTRRAVHQCNTLFLLIIEQILLASSFFTRQSLCISRILFEVLHATERPTNVKVTTFCAIISCP